MAELKRAPMAHAFDVDFQPASVKMELDHHEGRGCEGAEGSTPRLGQLHLQSPSGAAIYFADPDGCPRWTPDPASYSKLFRD